MTKHAPSHLYARAYRALIEARPLLHPNPDADRESYINARVYAEQRGLDWDLSRAAYTLAMNVATALAALPEFPPERCDMICAACWKLNPRTGARGSVAHVDAVLVEVHRLGEEAAREEATAAAIAPVRSER